MTHEVIYGDLSHLKFGSMTHARYQRDFCETAERPILNAACKEDPHSLGADYDATNLDLLTFDPHTNCDMPKLPNFVNGDLRALPFLDESFASVVLGEFIEHCIPSVAATCLAEVARVLKPGGKLCLTFPLDAREKTVQHAARHLVEWAPGITSWHQTVWTDEMLAELLGNAGFTEISREPMGYGFAEGWGITAERI